MLINSVDRKRIKMLNKKYKTYYFALDAIMEFYGKDDIFIIQEQMKEVFDIDLTLWDTIDLVANVGKLYMNRKYLMTCFI